MQYMGGKSRLAKDLARVIGGGGRLWEPFCGGGAMTAALAPQFDSVEASDTHEDLILMWQALKAGWTPPSGVSEADYARLRSCPPSALRGFAGFAASWGGKWFGGYARSGARSHAAESARSLARDVNKLSNVTFSQKSYTEISPLPGDTIYADPPYAGTTGYGKPFDSVSFWRTAESWAKAGALVFVSEYAAPEDWPCVWDKAYARSMKADLVTASRVTDKLFFKSVW